MEDISLGEIDRDIAIGVRRIVIFKCDCCAVKMKRLVGVEHVSRNRAGRRWRKSEVPIYHSRAARKVFPGILMSGDGRARGVHPLVAVGVIEMPMRIDQMLDRIRTETV